MLTWNRSADKLVAPTGPVHSGFGGQAPRRTRQSGTALSPLLSSRSNRPATFACSGRPLEAPRKGHPTRGLMRMPRWAGRCAGWMVVHRAGWQDGWSARRRAGCGLPHRPSSGLPARLPSRIPPSASRLPSRAFPRQTTTLPEGGRFRVRVRVLVRRAMRRVPVPPFCQAALVGATVGQAVQSCIRSVGVRRTDRPCTIWVRGVEARRRARGHSEALSPSSCTGVSHRFGITIGHRPFE